LWLIVVILSATVTVAQDAPFKSGPLKGTVLPAPFDALIVKGVVQGKAAKDRQHCLICQNGLKPALLIFAREPGKDMDAPLTSLLAKLDKAVEVHAEAYLGGFVVFVSPDARSSVTESASDDIDKLLDEAKKRKELLERLNTRAEPLKNVVVAAYPDDGPKGYNVNPKADVTVVFYQKLKVIENWAFEAGKMTDDHVAAIMKKVDETLTMAKKKKK
jgi:hypothetical protein